MYVAKIVILSVKFYPSCIYEKDRLTKRGQPLAVVPLPIPMCYQSISSDAAMALTSGSFSNSAATLDFSTSPISSLNNF